MENYADISELDDKVEFFKFTWRKMVDYAATFAAEYLALDKQFDTGRYGPDWTFARWLGVKCSMSRRTCYRIIQQVHRVSAADQQEQVRQALEQIRKTTALDKTNRRASQAAWDRWRAEEKDRQQMTQAAWDQWAAEEKQRRKDEREAVQKTKAHERKKKADRERARGYRRDAKAKKEQKNKEIETVALSNLEIEKAVPNLAQVTNGDLMRKLDAILDQLVAVINQFPGFDRATCKERIIQRLSEVDDGSGEVGESAGYARFDA